MPVDRAGKPHADAEHPVALDARLRQQVRDDPRPRVERRSRPGVHVEIHAALRDDARREIGDRDAHVPVAVVDADDGSRRGVEA